MHKLPPQAQTRRIEAKTVVIFDDADHGRIWSHPLTDSGIDTVAIPLDEKTISLLADLLPDLIVLEDFNHKPEELALCAHLRQETPIPILLLTVRDDEEFHLRAYQAGVDECIALPINPQLFVAKVRAWLGRTLSLPASAVNEIHCVAVRLEPASTSARRARRWAKGRASPPAARPPTPPATAGGRGQRRFHRQDGSHDHRADSHCSQRPRLVQHRCHGALDVRGCDLRRCR